MQPGNRFEYLFIKKRLNFITWMLENIRKHSTDKEPSYKIFSKYTPVLVI